MLARRFQIVIATTKLDEHFSQSNQVLNLIAQAPSMLAAQFIEFGPLFLRHADVESEIFLCHFCNLPEGNYELMAKKG
ncbi:MAG: hypothetical protein KGR98_07870 [Verrucomicrobia bacterium]|nr:hypothetical protein [Verrucomicrobiota bacterium]